MVRGLEYAIKFSGEDKYVRQDPILKIERSELIYSRSMVNEDVARKVCRPNSNSGRKLFSPPRKKGAPHRLTLRFAFQFDKNSTLRLRWFRLVGDSFPVEIPEFSYEGASFRKRPAPASFPGAANRVVTKSLDFSSTVLFVPLVVRLSGPLYQESNLRSSVSVLAFIRLLVLVGNLLPSVVSTKRNTASATTSNIVLWPVRIFLLKLSAEHGPFVCLRGTARLF
jgi:hypothetical protein